MPCHDGVVALGFLGRRCYGVRACSTSDGLLRRLVAAALVWSLASAPFYVVLQLSDEVRRAASAKFASNVQQLEQKL